MKKRYFTEKVVGQPLEQAPEGSGYGTKPLCVQGPLGKCSQMYYGIVLDNPAES